MVRLHAPVGNARTPGPAFPAAVVHTPSSAILSLQRAAGNAAVSSLVVQRFDSFEHRQLGDRAADASGVGYILLECHARDLPNHATPTRGWPEEWAERYRRGSPLQQRVIREGLTYGEIVALSGDMYADIDPVSKGTSVVGAMRRLNKASLREIHDLVPLMRAPDASTAELEDATGGRYIALASKNLSHFSTASGGRNNLDTWREGHVAAIELAGQGHANGAWALSAAADHFLTDAFSSGHMRQDRERLMNGGANQVKAKVMHDLDNDYGVAVHNRRGDKWIAYGDDNLNPRPDDGPNVAANKRFGASLATEAVSRSQADIAGALHARPAPGVEPTSSVGSPAAYSAEELIPVVDDAGVSRWGRADVAAELGHLAVHELPEQMTPNGDRRAREWVAKQPDVALRDMPLDEKLRMVRRMFKGWVSDGDLGGIVRLYRASSSDDRAAIRRAIDPGDLVGFGQRARLRSVFSEP